MSTPTRRGSKKRSIAPETGPLNIKVMILASSILLFILAAFIPLEESFVSIFFLDLTQHLTFLLWTIFAFRIFVSIQPFHLPVHLSIVCFV
jgi:hypothetical protein